MSESAQAALAAAEETEAPKLDSQPKEPKAAAPRARRTSTAKPRPQRRAKAVDIEKGITELYTAIGLGVSLVPSKPSAINPEHTVTASIGYAIGEQAPKIGAAWKQIADDNPQVREALERLLTVSAVGALITAHAPILIVAATAAGMMPPTAGVVLAGALDGGER